jgi:hypothetical protein
MSQIETINVVELQLYMDLDKLVYLAIKMEKQIKRKSSLSGFVGFSLG